MSALRPRERVARALRGEPVDRPPTGPLAVHFCATVAGASLRDYTDDPRVLADCVLRYFDEYRPDAVWLSADTWVTAEAVGAAVGYPGADQPKCGTGEPLIHSAADLDRIPAPDPGTLGRMPVMLDALELVKRAIGDQAFVVACFDQLPFSLACALMGPGELMFAMIDDPSLVADLIDRCADHVVAYARALAERGADMLSGGDSPAGLIGPDRYRDVALPAEQRVFAALRQWTDVPLSLHICGDVTGLLPLMAGSGADVLELDHLVDLGHARRSVGPEIALWGNLDPVGVLSGGDPQSVRRATRAVLERADPRLVLSSGCTLAVETPAANLRAMLDTAREWPDA